MHKIKYLFSAPTSPARRIAAVLIAAAGTFLFAAGAVSGQVGTPAVPTEPARNGIALSPARVELELAAGAEATLVLNLDYQTSDARKPASRIVASLNDWDISAEGQINFYKKNTFENSATGWLTFTPAETLVPPNSRHSIRVTVSVPQNAAPGDHLAALVIEQRPDNLKLSANAKTINVRYRMAAVFYIKIPALEKRGELAGLSASGSPTGIVVTPTLRNAGNTVLRPSASLRITDRDGTVVAEMPETDSLPVLGGKELRQRLVIEKNLPPGIYTVAYLVDFNDDKKATAGQTKLTVTGAVKNVAAAR